MLAGFLGWPIAVRIAGVALVAIVAARFINWAIYNWAYNRRALGPWAKPPLGARPHTMLDHVPIWGWYALRRESDQVGKSFWIRPLLIELLFPAAIAWYYYFYVGGGALDIPAAQLKIQPQLHCQFVGHFVLFTLMTIATFIDFDEHSIPDYITVPGTVIGLAGATFALAWLPFRIFPAAGFNAIEEMHCNAPFGWPNALNGSQGLAIALLIVCVWGFALLDRRWITRRGFRKAIQYFFARLLRNRAVWLPILCVTVGLLVAISCVWFAGLARWQYLMSSLLGLAFGGGFTWAVRLSASWGLRVEALGFGDVTLMAMIGTFLGWQASLIVFFLGPLIALMFVLVRRLVTGESTTPYGPYLCGATVVLLVFWDSLWTNWAERMFDLGGMFFVGIGVSCVVLMGALLWIWRLIKQALGIEMY
ncbi:MAG: prepilin peptidase [Planctomycetales bacterium]|nr:prepilin peptidase [Planctomycetales bacterium]